MAALSDEQLQDLYTWVDKIPLSRPKRNIARDFSDGEIINHYHPKLVEIHNYTAAHSLKQKIYNWETLNKKVLRRLHFTLGTDDMQAVASCKPHAIERLLLRLRGKIASYQPKGGTKSRKQQHSSHREEESELRPDSNDFGGRSSSRNQYDSGLHASNNNSSSSRIPMDRDVQFLLDEKDQTILELRDTISIMELKIKKLEQLVQLKDNKITAMQQQI